MKQLTRILIVLAVFFLLQCKGKKEQPAPVTEITEVKGSASAYADLYNEQGTHLKQDRSGIQVTLLESSPKITVTTDSAGKFEFKNVKTGTYTLQLQIEGFPEYQYEEFVISEGMNNYYTTYILSQTPVSIPSNLRIYVDSSDFPSTEKKVWFRVKVIPVNKERNDVLFVLSNKPEISLPAKPINTNKDDYTFVYIHTDTEEAIFGITYQELKNRGISGNIVFCKAYVIASGDYDNAHFNDNRYFPSQSLPSNEGSVLLR